MEPWALLLSLAAAAVAPRPLTSSLNPRVSAAKASQYPMPAHHVQPPKKAPPGQPKLVFSAGSFQGFSTPKAMPTRAHQSSSWVGNGARRGTLPRCRGRMHRRVHRRRRRRAAQRQRRGGSGRSHGPMTIQVRDGPLWAYTCDVFQKVDRKWDENG